MLYDLIDLGNPDPLPPYMANRILDIGTIKGNRRSPNLCVSFLAEITDAVQTGLGVALLHTEYEEGNPSLVRLLPHVPPFCVDLYYTYPKYHQNTKRITDYGEFLVEKLDVLSL